MYTNVRLQGLPCIALLDDGASACFIDKDIVLERGLRTVPVEPMHITLGDDSKVSADTAVITELRLANGIRYKATLYVMSLGPAPVILGQRFYQDMQLVVDYGPARTLFFPATANRAPAILRALPAPTLPRAAPTHLAVLSASQMNRELRRNQRSQSSAPFQLGLIHLRVSTQCHKC
jgi:hypothetical protein